MGTAIVLFVLVSVALAVIGERARPGTPQNLIEWGAIIFSWLALVASIIWALQGAK